MLRHSGYCAGLYSLEDAPRSAPNLLYCVCGHSTSVGTDMLTHLLVTRHSTAYASEEEARANIALDPAASTTGPAATLSKNIDVANEVVSVSASI